MNKLIKGAVTGAAGIALLLGGAGTFAAWNDSTSFGAEGNSVSTGTLSVGLDTSAAAGWYDITPGTTNTGPIADISSYKLVPGDVIEYRQPLVVHAQGANLTARLGFENASLKKAIDTANDPNFTVRESLKGQTADTDGNYTVTDGKYTALLDITFNAGTSGNTDHDAQLSLTNTKIDLVETAPATGTLPTH